MNYPKNTAQPLFVICLVALLAAGCQSETKSKPASPDGKPAGTSDKEKTPTAKKASTAKTDSNPVKESAQPSAEPRTKHSKGPVAVEVTHAPADDDPAVVELNVTFTIEPGWHLYATLPLDTTFIQTTVDLKLPAGIEAETDWEIPLGTPSLEEADTSYFDGTATFTRRLTKPKTATPLSIKILWQACDETQCLPPVNTTLTTIVSP